MDKRSEVMIHISSKTLFFIFIVVLVIGMGLVLK